MNRVRVRACLGVLLAVTVLVYVGCSTSSQPAPARRPRPHGGGTSKAAQASAADSAKSTKLLADWPKPEGVLIVSGEMDGYLEPCGCTAGPARRPDPPARPGRAAEGPGLAARR